MTQPSPALTAEHLRGNVVMTRHYDREGGSTITVGHADQRVAMHPDVAITVLGREPVMGDIIKITGTNREVVYRIVGRDYVHDLWLLAWPD